MKTCDNSCGMPPEKAYADRGDATPLSFFYLAEVMDANGSALLEELADLGGNMIELIAADDTEISQHPQWLEEFMRGSVRTGAIVDSENPLRDLTAEEKDALQQLAAKTGLIFDEPLGLLLNREDTNFIEITANFLMNRSEAQLKKDLFVEMQIGGNFESWSFREFDGKTVQLIWVLKRYMAKKGWELEVTDTIDGALYSVKALEDLQQHSNAE